MVLVRSQMASYPAPFPSRVKVPFPSSPFCVLFWNHSAHAEVCLSASLCSYVIMLVALGYREVFACVCAKSLQSCLTLCDPMDCNRPGSLSMRFSRHEYWRGLPCPPPRDLPDPRIKPKFLLSLQLADGFFTTSATWEASVPHKYTSKLQ